ncbi:MAG: 2,3-bisphosphoglycerate-independent phosphoglycerate mutase [Bacteroidetes bacterium]|nr:2,3-bisphosphoglycerate-independent phosphoglycerate mutase [Bacteroidota bacterium]HET6243177.1 2,3-bisphosphoglycerate-independent phosphoglycerate mutase [Bacteroidia bacterium]
MNNKKIALLILDGWGKGNGSESDAIANAQTPFINSLYKKYPHSQLVTSGESVGLPEGQMGNSEVGHLNLGAGRIVYQDLGKINMAIKDKSIETNAVLNDAFNYAKENNKPVHFLGLLSEGGVHSSQAHLHKLCDMAKDHKIENVYIHAFTDGRDTDPKSGLNYLSLLQKHLENSAGQIATVIGRYFAMDRDKRWERVMIAYNAVVKGQGSKTKDVLNAVRESYENGVSDEFIKPILNTDENGTPIGSVKQGDVVICFNFRTDRCREITMALHQQDFPEYEMHKLNLYYVTMTNYDDRFKNVKIIFEKDNLINTIGEVLARANKKQLRVAETEKYPHVTFFFSGGREKIFEGEKRILVASPKVPTYDLKPEMSAQELTLELIQQIENSEADFICVNYANPDMVGHTGVYKAIVKAVETVDKCAEQVVKKGLEKGYSFLILSDHGNADYVLNKDGSPNTAHTTNPVPCILIDRDYKQIKNGKLGDIAPTILKMMAVEIPKEMNGDCLV